MRLARRRGRRGSTTTAILLTPHLLEPLDAGARADHPAVGRLQPRLPRRRRPRRPRARSSRGGRTRLRDRLQARGRGGAALGAAVGRPRAFAVRDVGVLRDERFNVGHWNLPERSVEDVRLFRFSGYEPDAPERATRYADRLATGSLNGAAEYFARYRAALLDAGWEEALRVAVRVRPLRGRRRVPALARELLRRARRRALRRPVRGRAGLVRGVAARAGRRALARREPAVARAAPAARRPARRVRDPLGADRAAFAALDARDRRAASTACRRARRAREPARALGRWSRSWAATACRPRACWRRRCASTRRRWPSTSCWPTSWSPQRREPFEVHGAARARARRRRARPRLRRRSSSACASSRRARALLDEGYSAALFLDATSGCSAISSRCGRRSSAARSR